MTTPRPRPPAEADCLTLAYHHANVGIAVLDPQGFYLEANPRYCEIIGRGLEELRGHRPSDFTHPEDLANESQGIRETAEGRRAVYDAEKRYLMKNGSPTWVRVSGTVVRNTDGAARYLIGSVEDINLQKLAERKLSDALRQLKQAERVAGIGSFVRDIATGEGHWSDSLFSIFGLDPATTVPSLDSYFSVVHPEDAGWVRNLVMEARAAGRDMDYEHRILRPDGETRRVLVRITTRPGPGGSAKGLLGVVQDITARREAERLLDEQRMRLVASSKMSALGEMAGGIAHEINNPLAIILGNSMILRTALAEDKMDRETLVQGLDKIEKTSNRIARIVKGLRAFARGGDNDPHSLVTVRQVVDDTLELCREKFRARTIQLEVGELPGASIECRPAQVSQVLLNLLSNAYDATLTHAQPWVRIDVTVTGDRAFFSVSNSGEKIRPEVARRMMEPFFTTKDVNQGTGLGLSISKGIAEDHGGELRYEPGACTRFVLELPLRQR